MAEQQAKKKRKKTLWQVIFGVRRPGEKYFYDYSLVFAVVFLTAVGLVMIHSSSSYMTQINNQDPMYHLRRQGLIALGGFLLMILVSRMDYHWMLKFGVPLYFVSCVLLVYAAKFGIMVNGKRRWIRLPGGVSFQPTELAKLALILFYAVYAAKNVKKLRTVPGIIVMGCLELPIFFLVAKNNLSSGIIVLGLAAIISFVASDVKWIYGAALAGVSLVVAFAAQISESLVNAGILEPYQLSRILVWKAPEQYPLDGGYQVLQGLYAIGSGGVMGRGLGESIQKMGSLPESQNDMIFAIICEELGLFGAVSIILVFLFVIYRCMVIANDAPDMYGSFLVVGVMAQIAMQVVFNIAVVTNSMPNTGVTLPFISAGGTSILFLMVEMGIVLSVAHTIRLN